MPFLCRLSSASRNGTVATTNSQQQPVHMLDFLDYPEKHNRRFKGDLVSPIPEIQRHKLAETGVFDEFLLLACDGLWDVMDPYDAIQVARRLLFDEKSTAKDTVSTGN